MGSFRRWFAKLAVACAVLIPVPALAQVTVNVSPSGGSFISASLTVTISWCSEVNWIDGGSQYITLNGVDVTENFTFSEGGGSGCTEAPEGGYYSGRSIGTITLATGSNTLSAEITDNYSGFGYGGASYTLALPVATVVVTRTGAGTIGVGQTSGFTARTYAANSTELTGRSVSWSGSYVSVSPTSGSSVASTTATGTSAGSGSVTATSEGVSDSEGITVVNPTYAVSVSSNRSTNITLSAGATTTGTTTYTITNTSTYTDLSSTFSLSATPSGAPIGSCSVSPTSVLVAPGGQSNITVSCPIGITTSSSSPTVTFAASTTSPATFSNSHVTTFNVSPNYAFTVTMPSGSSKTEPAQTTSGSTTFRVTNNSTNTGTTSVSFTATCAGVLLNGCSNPSNVSLAAGGNFADVTLPYTVSMVGVNGTAQLQANAGGQAPNATFTVYTTPYAGGVTVFGSSPQAIPQGNTSGSTNFTVRNNNKNTGPVTYTLSETCGGTLVSACTGVQATVQLNDQQTSNTLTATYGVSKSETAGTVTLTAFSSTPAASNNYVTNVTGTPVYARANATVAYADSVLNASRCVADCFEATHSFTGPSYRSLDQDRAITLLYRSNRAKPRATVEFDVVDPSIDATAKLSLKLWRTDNSSFITFTNNSTEIFFQRASGSNAVRIAAQFDASIFTTGSHKLYAYIRSHWADTTLDRVDTVRVTVINGASSEFGAGWEIAQLQRVYFPSGGYLVTSGDGSATFFKECSGTPCTMGAPAAEPSTLERISASPAQYRRTYPDGTKLHFNSTGLMTSAWDRLSNKDSVTRDGSGRVTAITDPTGYALTVTYDGNGKVASLTAPGVGGTSRTANLTVSGGDLTQAFDADGIKNFSATYSNHLLGAVTDRRGGAWTSTYHGADGLLDSLMGPSIGAAGSPTVRFGAPSRAILASITGGAGTDTSNLVPNTLDRRAWIKNPRGYTTYATVSKWGAATRVDNVDGTYSTDNLDASGRVVRSQDATGHVVKYTWSSYLLTKMVDSTRADSVSATYTTYARQASITAAVSQTFTYNDASKKYSVTANGIADTIYYDGFGRDTLVKDGGGHVTRAFYGTSGLRNTDSTEVPGSPTPRRTKHRYDSFGRPVAVVFPDGRRDSTVYDLVDRVTKSVDGVNGVTTFAYDSLYLRSVTDARLKVTTFTTNALGWVTQENRAGSSNPLKASYDVAGNVDSTWNRRGQKVSFQYDSLDRVVSRTAHTENKTATFAFRQATPTVKGFVAGVNTESADTTFVNVKGQLDSIMTRRGSKWYSLGYRYRTVGALDSVSARSSEWTGAKVQSYGYNASTWALDTIRVLWASGVADTTRLFRTANSEGAVDSVRLSSTLKQYQVSGALHRSYSSTYNLASVRGKLGVKVSFDANSRLATRRNDAGDTLHTYAYDALGRLTSDARSQILNATCTPHNSNGMECAGPDTVAIATTSLTYDAVGNKTPSGNTFTYPPDSGNRLVGSNSFGTKFSYQYDADGNLTQRYDTAAHWIQSLHWNSLGQLDSVKTVDSVSSVVTTVTFGYDAFGQRVRKTVNGTNTGYLLRDDNVNFVLNASGAPVEEYAYWGLDQPLMLRKGGATYFYAQDPMGGSVRGVVRKSDNKVLSYYDYAPNGYLVGTSFDSISNRFRFGGREYDAETKLYYNRARYLDDNVGRFISEDPVGAAGGANYYTYAGNDPVNFNDPAGLAAQSARWCLAYWSWTFRDGTYEGKSLTIPECSADDAASSSDNTPPPNQGTPKGGGPSGPKPRPQRRNACGPILSQPAVRNSANRVWNQHINDPQRREFAEALMRSKGGNLYGVPVLGYTSQTSTDATYNAPRGSVGGVHSHPEDGRNGLWGDWDRSINNPSGGGIKIVVTKDSMFLLPSYPLLVFEAAVTEACARSGGK
jgi:RHS repeat-associated protein